MQRRAARPIRRRDAESRNSSSVFAAGRGTFAALEAFWRRFPGIEPAGIFVIEDQSGEIVATASTRLDPAVRARGWIHLVATRSDQRRRGMATLIVMHALRYLAARGRLPGMRRHRGRQCGGHRLLP